MIHINRVATMQKKKTTCVLGSVLAFLLCLSLGTVQGQTPASGNTLPAVTLTALDGSKLSAASLHNDGQPIIIVFWATWCHHTMNGLGDISDEYEEWQEETGVKVIAISTDDSRSSAKVNRYVGSEGWDFEVYLDPNGDLARNLGVSGAPFILMYDGQLNEVLRRDTFLEGDVDVLFEQLQTLNE